MYSNHSLLDGIKDTLHIEIHHLGEHLLGMRIELLAPSGTRVGEENVDMISGLSNLRGQSLNLLDARTIGRDGDGLRTGSLVGEGVKCCDGLFTGVLLAGGDVDLGASGLQQSAIEHGRQISIIDQFLLSDTDGRSFRLQFMQKNHRADCHHSPRSSVQAQTTRATRHHGDLSLEGEDGGEVGETDLIGGGHCETMCMYSWDVEKSFKMEAGAEKERKRRKSDHLKIQGQKR